MQNNSVKHPCQGCVYFNACGENTRTMPCAGRVTKSQAKQQAKANNSKRTGGSVK